MDTEAERRLVGIAVTSAYGAELAAARVDPADFYDPALERLFVAAITSTKRRTQDRILDIAQRAGEYASKVRQLEELDRLSLHDESGSYSRRVTVAAQRRGAFLEAVEVFG